MISLSLHQQRRVDSRDLTWGGVCREWCPPRFPSSSLALLPTSPMLWPRPCSRPAESGAASVPERNPYFFFLGGGMDTKELSQRLGQGGESGASNITTEEGPCGTYIRGINAGCRSRDSTKRTSTPAEAQYLHLISGGVYPAGTYATAGRWCINPDQPKQTS